MRRVYFAASYRLTQCTDENGTMVACVAFPFAGFEPYEPERVREKSGLQSMLGAQTVWYEDTSLLWSFLRLMTDIENAVGDKRAQRANSPERLLFKWLERFGVPWLYNTEIAPLGEGEACFPLKRFLDGVSAIRASFIATAVFRDEPTMGFARVVADGKRIFLVSSDALNAAYLQLCFNYGAGEGRARMCKVCGRIYEATRSDSLCCPVCRASRSARLRARKRDAQAVK